MPNENISINGDIKGVGIATGGTVNQIINYYQSRHITPRQLTSKLGQDTIVGRKKELIDIDNLLYNKSPLLLIHGIGGVGKSILASYYLHTQKENLDYYGFFEGLDSFVNELRHPLNLKSEKYQDAFIEALVKLSSLEGKKLLIFDDVRDIEENQEIIDKILSLTHSGYKIIFTSREEIEYIVSYHLNPFSIDNAKEFFNSIYSVVKEDDKKLLEEILSYIDYHPLFIELIAKTLKNRKILTLQKIKNEFEKGDFSKIKIKKRENFKQYLNRLFTLDKLDDEEILILKQFSVLPSIEIEFNFLEEIFNKKDYEEFEEILIYLCEKGWLSSFKNGYKLHQIIKEYILSTYPPIFKEIEVMVDFFIELMGDTGDKKIAISHENNIIYFESLAKVFELIEVENEKIVEFFNSLGLLYQTLEENDKIESCYLKALTISQKKLGKNNLSTAVSANNLAGLYWFQGVYEKAESLYTKALKITEHILGENHPYTVTNYNNLAGLYLSMKDYDKAEPLYLKALKKSEEILEKSHPSITIIHQNINALKQKQNKFFFLNSQSSNLTFKIDNIEIENFKQYSKFTIEFSKNINIIVG